MKHMHGPTARYRQAAISVALLAAGALVLSGCSGAADPDDGAGGEDGVSFSFMLGPGESSPLQHLEPMAAEGGVYEDLGIDIEWSSGQNGPELGAGLVSGGTDFALQVTGAALSLVEQGECLQFLTGNNTQYVNLIAGPEAELEHEDEGYPDSALDLKGKRIGVVSLGGAQEAVVNVILDDVGLTPQDVTLIAVGPPPTGIPALEQGQIDVYYASAPAELMIGEGNYKTVVALAETPEAPQDGIYQSLFATTCEYADSHPEEVKAFCAAAQEARTWALDPANSDAMIGHLAESNGFDEETAAKAWDQYATTVWPADVSLTEEMWDGQALWFGKEPPAYEDNVSADCQAAIAEVNSGS